MQGRIVQKIELEASPASVFYSLTNSNEFSDFTGKRALIEARSGGSFSACDGRISGINIELIPSKRIVQAWRIRDWPEGTYSIVKFDLSDKGGRTSLTLEQSGFPGGKEEHLSSGWKVNYLEPLKNYFET